MTDLSENKVLVRRHLLEAINGKRPELWAEIMDEGFDLHHPLLEPGRDNYRDAVAVLWAAFPDVTIEILDLVAEDDRVAVRYIERGTHLGEFLETQPSGRTYEKHGFALYRIANNQLAEAWAQEDDAGWQQQLFG